MLDAKSNALKKVSLDIHTYFPLPLSTNIGLKVKSCELFDHFMFKEFEDQRHHLDVLHIALMESIETQHIQGRFKNVWFLVSNSGKSCHTCCYFEKYSFLENFLSFLVKLNENFSQTLFKILFSELSGFESIKFQLQNKF